MKKNILILFLDDDKLILEGIKAQLKNEFDATIYLEFEQDGNEAYDLIEEAENSDDSTVIVVSDWIMPQMRGSEFLQKVEKDFPEVVKIVLSGELGDQKNKDELDKIDLYKVLHKPWDKSVLLSTLNEVVLQINKDGEKR